VVKRILITVVVNIAYQVANVLCWKVHLRIRAVVTYLYVSCGAGSV